MSALLKLAAFCLAVGQSLATPAPWGSQKYGNTPQMYNPQQGGNDRPGNYQPGNYTGGNSSGSNGRPHWWDGDQYLESGAKLSALEQQGNANIRNYIARHPPSNGCHAGNTAVRQEFRKMSKPQRKAFTDAVTCLMHKPSNLRNNATHYPGAKSRFDDWAVGHIEFDQGIHFTGQFLHWHRYAIWTFEKDLRDLCGYRGWLPYWDWGLDATADNPINQSEIFNGDQYSMGGNGAKKVLTQPAVFTIPLPTSFLNTLPNPQSNVTLPTGSGTGGGCIPANGPFGGNDTAHIGPTLVDFYGTPATGIQNAYKYNPRCIVRDLNPWVMNNFNTFRNITEAITNYTTITDFQRVLQSDSRAKFTIGNIGVHAGGHVGAGGDPMSDQPSTPNDPLWFLHHAQIDRMWNIWQAQDLENRINVVGDTLTILNYPPSRNMTLDDSVDLAYIGKWQGNGPGSASPPSTVDGMAKSWDGPFCYIYN